MLKNFFVSLRVGAFLTFNVIRSMYSVLSTPKYNVGCHLLTWETHKVGHRLAHGHLSSPYPPSTSFRSFGAASVILCGFPPRAPLRPFVYFLEEALLIKLVHVS